MPIVLLVDNGSIRASATLQLRYIAQQLSEQNNEIIHPVSLQHSNAIPAEQLDGYKASILVPFLQGQLERGEREFIVLPLFFGNSGALTRFIPESTAVLQQKYKDLDIKIADVLYPLPKGDFRLVDILYDHIQQTATKYSLPLKNIALVDHGSPIPYVTDVRKRVAEAIQVKLAKIRLEQAVMERRAGNKYEFNGNLLEDWLADKAEKGEHSAIVALLFSLPGRHAGPDGDVVSICESVMQRYPHFKIGISPLVGEHELLLKMLQERLNTELTYFSSHSKFDQT